MIKSIKKQLPFALTLLGLFAFRSSFADQYVVPSGSMEPTIHVGDHVIVDKRAYDVKIPFTDHSLFTTGAPRRGDVVVFRDPRDPSINLIKRLVGLPGDHVRVVDGTVEINGKALAVSQPMPDIEGRIHGRGAAFTYLEDSGSDLPAHAVQRLPGRAMLANQEFSVPVDHYFFLGDNRDNSADSRYWGFATREALRGRALGVLCHVSWSEALPRVSLDPRRI